MSVLDRRLEHLTGKQQLSTLAECKHSSINLPFPTSDTWRHVLILQTRTHGTRMAWHSMIDSGQNLPPKRMFCAYPLAFGILKLFDTCVGLTGIRIHVSDLLHMCHRCCKCKAAPCVSAQYSVKLYSSVSLLQSCLQGKSKNTYLGWTLSASGTDWLHSVGIGAKNLRQLRKAEVAGGHAERKRQDGESVPQTAHLNKHVQ